MVSGEKSGHVIFAGAFNARVEILPRVALNGNNVYGFCLLESAGTGSVGCSPTSRLRYTTRVNHANLKLTQLYFPTFCAVSLLSALASNKFSK